MAVLGIIVHIILSILLIGPLQHGGLALAYSIGGIVNLFLLMWALRRRLGHVNIRSILKSSLQTLFASGIMGIAAWPVSYTHLDVYKRQTDYILIAPNRGQGVVMVLP